MQRCLLLFSLVLLTACSASQASKPFNLTKEEHVFLEKFFRYWMLRETAIYTLIGSKPLTEFYLFYYDNSEEQKKDRENLYFLLNQNNKKDMEFYESLSSIEKQEKAYLISEKDFIHNIEDLWGKWERIQHRFPLKKRFLLIKKERPKDHWKDVFPTCRAVYDIFFVDILKTALVIQEHYGLFKQAVGFDFDPIEIVFQLEKEHSRFWDIIGGKDAWKYSPLWGILYGFGKENSFSFLWKNRHIRNLHSNEQEKLFALNLPKWSSCPDSPWFDDKNGFSISNFGIPIFASFTENDPIIARYEAEREKIKKLYQGKDFVTYTLELLTDFNPQTEFPFRLIESLPVEKAS